MTACVVVVSSGPERNWAAALLGECKVELAAQLSSADEGLRAAIEQALGSQQVDAVLWACGQDEPGELLETMRSLVQEVPLIVLNEATPDALRELASDVLDWPADRDALLFAVGRAQQLGVVASQPPSTAPAQTDELLGKSKQIEAVRKLVARAAGGNSTILIRGETGTGKALVARAIHDGSERAAERLVTVHCASLPETLLESELFGYEKGAFTGAATRKKGRVELAQGGTLFLDEIGDISAATQVKLLRLLQEREFERLGSNQPIKADLRFIAATHRDLNVMVKRGEFREDLFYRLNVVPIWVPPLRTRGDDVKLLAAQFCQKLARESKRSIVLSAEALDLIAKQSWPGNVRQLQNFVERLVVLTEGSSIEATDVNDQLSYDLPEGEQDQPDDVKVVRTAGGFSGRTSIISAVIPLEEEVRRAEKHAMRKALHHAKGNRSKAARLLGVARATFYKKMNEYDLS